MKTNKLHWNTMTTEQASEEFKSAFKDVIILPNMDVFKALQKATEKKGELRNLRFVENNDDYETTMYSFESFNETTMYADIDADSGVVNISTVRL